MNEQRTECPECKRDLNESIMVPAGQTCPGCSTFTAPVGASGAGAGVPEGSPAPAPALPASPDPEAPAKIKFTSKIRRGLALMRMVNITALDETGDLGTPSSPQKIMQSLTKRQMEEYDAALQWIDQEEDWDAVASVWAKAGGK